MSTRASNRGLSSAEGGGRAFKASSSSSPAPASVDSSGSSASGAEDPISPRLKEAEAAESLSSLRNLMPQRQQSSDPNMPPMPPSMSRFPSSRDAYEPAPSLRRAGSNSGPVMPNLSRSTSQPGIINGRPFFLSDWRASVTVEERQEVRRKIQAAYANQSRSYDDLVELVTSVEEEFLHMCSPSRLDYIKNSVQYDKRLADKKRQLRGDVDSLSGDLTASTSSTTSTSTSSATSTGKEEGKGGKEGNGTKRTKMG